MIPEKFHLNGVILSYSRVIYTLEVNLDSKLLLEEQTTIVAGGHLHSYKLCAICNYSWTKRTCSGSFMPYLSSISSTIICSTKMFFWKLYLVQNMVAWANIAWMLHFSLLQEMHWCPVWVKVLVVIFYVLFDSGPGPSSPVFICPSNQIK